MTFVVTLAQIKGGVGKTTVAVNLAGEMTRLGWGVTLVDVDPQRSATQWAAPNRLGFPVKPEPFGTRPAIWVRNVLKTDTDVVVVDLPAGASPALEHAILISDVVVIPCGPSSMDINAAGATIRKAREVLRIDPSLHLNFLLVPTRVDTSVEEGSQVSSELRRLGGKVGPALSADIAFVRSFSDGMTVGTFAPQSAADEEVKALTLFMIDLAGVRAEPTGR